jgi:hypothetical protein
LTIAPTSNRIASSVGYLIPPCATPLFLRRSLIPSFFCESELSRVQAFILRNTLRASNSKFAWFTLPTRPPTNSNNLLKKVTLLFFSSTYSPHHLPLGKHKGIVFRYCDFRKGTTAHPSRTLLEPRILPQDRLRSPAPRHYTNAPNRPANRQTLRSSS